MTLTPTDVLTHVRRRLGGAPSIDPVRLANLAGRHLVGMNAGGWSWTLRPPATVRFQANSTKARLPDDYLKTAAVQCSLIGSSQTLQEVDVHSMALLRGQGISSTTLAYYALLVWDTDVETKLLTPYWELFPTPSAVTTFTLWYYARWRDVTQDTDEVPLPATESVGLLYLEIADAIARGHDEHDEGSIAQRIVALRASPFYMDALAEDGTRVSGPLPQKGGMVQNGSVGGDWWLYPDALPGPGG